MGPCLRILLLSDGHVYVGALIGQRAFEVGFDHVMCCVCTASSEY